MSRSKPENCPANYLYQKVRAVKFFRISIMTSMERNEAITKVSEAINGNGGWIVNHTLLSNIAATLNFELPRNEVEGFISSLETASFLPEFDGPLLEKKKGDLRGQITLTFIHSDPELKRNVPAFG
ncbi:hypothetical protein [Kiloniella sp.]|uniref:hypothetical protein n=1 Tax=Kiloniella sp. TaxID=1938587 RepID=UPI003B0151D7